MKRNHVFNYASVIVTYNRKALLIEAVESILNQSIRPTKVIIIDNNSNDGTEESLLKNGIIDNSNVQYVKLSRNIGGSGGFYEGIKAAKKIPDVDWISLSDDDAIFQHDYFEKISLEFAKKAGKVRAFSGTVKLNDGRIQLSHRRIVTNRNYIHEKIVPKEAYTSNFNIDIASFVGLVISVDIVDSIGLPRKDFFIWYDDIEYSLRIRELTCITNVSSAHIIHKTKIVSDDFSLEYKTDWREYYGIRNRMVTIKTHTRNSFIGYIYIFYSFISELLKCMTHRYRGKRGHFLYVLVNAYFDAIFNKMGENSRFLPSMK